MRVPFHIYILSVREDQLGPPNPPTAVAGSPPPRKVDQADVERTLRDVFEIAARKAVACRCGTEECLWRTYARELEDLGPLKQPSGAA